MEVLLPEASNFLRQSNNTNEKVSTSVNVEAAGKILIDEKYFYFKI